MKKALPFALLLCGCSGLIIAQQAVNPFIENRPGDATLPNVGSNRFPIFDLYVAGVCEQYAGACSALVEDFTFLNKNPAASSLLYSGPFIGMAHRNYVLSDAVQTFGFAHTIDQLGFGAAIRYAHSIFNGYDAENNIENIFSPAELAVSLNISYNLLRMGIIDGISLGMNAKGMLSFIPQIDSAVAVNKGAALFDIGLLVNMHALKIIDFARPNFAIALTYRNIGFSQASGDRQFAPGMLSFGFVYAPMTYLSLSADADWSIAATRSGAQFMDALGASVGLGISPADFLEFGGGFHIDATQYFFTAGVSIILLGAQIRFIQRFDLFTDFGTFSNFSVSISLKAQETIAPTRQLSVQKLYLQALQIFLAQDYELALTTVNQALVIAPNYRPALELKRQIAALRKIDELF